MRDLTKEPIKETAQINEPKPAPNPAKKSGETNPKGHKITEPTDHNHENVHLEYNEDPEADYRSFHHSIFR